MSFGAVSASLQPDLPVWNCEENDILVCRHVLQETHDVRSFIFSPPTPHIFRFEPGQFLTFQFKIGGLADSVIDANQAALAAGVATGIQFWPATSEALELALQRLLALWRDRPAWQRMQRNAMASDVSWRGPATRYVALYQSILADRV